MKALKTIILSLFAIATLNFTMAKKDRLRVTYCFDFLCETA